MILEVAISLFLVWLIWWITTTYKERKGMPPGPLPLPIIGNIVQLRFGMFQSLEKLSQKYGDIFTLTLPNESVVFITSGEIAREALVMNKDGLANRAVSPELSQVFEGKDIIMEPFGKKLLVRRKIIKSAMHVYGTLGLGKSAERANTAADTLIQAIDDLEGQPFSTRDLVRKSMISSLWKWLTSNECSLDHTVVRAIAEFNNLSDELAVVSLFQNSYPILRYLPSKLNKCLNDLQEIRDNIFGHEFHVHRQSYTSGVNRDLTDSFICGYEEELGKVSDSDIGSIKDVKGLMMDVLLAGVDTPSTFLVWFIVFLVVYPDLQDRLHEELDKVVGKDRKPGWKDTTKLHLLKATLQEVFRCSSAVPMLSRSVHSDTIISGYKVRKGTRVYVNLQSINNDPRSWREPELFRPERYLDSDGKFEGLGRFPDLMPFGTGVRRCPGENLGKLQLIMFSCSLLHRFKWKVPDGEKPPSLDPAGFGIFLLPKPHKVVAIKRF